MLTINSQPSPKAIVIWLHGLGADQNDFVDFINQLNLKEFMFILPNAPYRKITMNQGIEMRGWYDIKSLNFEMQDEAGLQTSMRYIESIIETQLETLKTTELFPSKHSNDSEVPASSFTLSIKSLTLSTYSFISNLDTTEIVCVVSLGFTTIIYICLYSN